MDRPNFATPQFPPLERCYECAEAGSTDKLGVLRCGECGHFAHRACLGLRDFCMLGNVHTCCWCETWNMWKGGQAAEHAAARISRDITKLEAEAREESSDKTYHYKLQAVRKWAAAEGFSEDDAFPAAPGKSMPHIIALGILAHGSKCWAASYLDGIRAAVGAWHANKNVANPMEGERAKSVLAAAKKKTLHLGHKGRGPKCPVSQEMMRGLIRWLELQAAVGDREKRDLYWRDEAWSVMGFHGLLRRSELGALNIGDVVLEPHLQRLRIYIRSSKTDPGRGQWVWLAWSTRSGVRIGDIIARWVDARRNAGAQSEDPLFTAWDQSARRMTAKPLDAKGEALAMQFRRHLTAMAAALNLRIDVSDYGSHSLRRGGANALKSWGATPREIQEHGRWSSECYRRYLERTAAERLALSARM